MLLKCLVDLIGIEPMTSSMPWSITKTKLLTLQHLQVGRVGKTGTIGTPCCQNAAKTSGLKGLTVWGQPVTSVAQTMKRIVGCVAPPLFSPR